MWRTAFLCVLGIATCLGGGPAWGRQVFTVGESEHPWKSSGTTPGGVVDFVDSLDAVRTSDGIPVFSAGPTAGPGWIMPLRLNPDMNISLGVIDRGGSIDVPNLDPSQKRQSDLQGMLNGNHRLAFDRKFVPGRIIRNNGISIRVDLGARFGVNRIVFYPRDNAQYPFGNDFLRAYELYVNDGLPSSLYASGQPIFTSPVVREEDNDQEVVDIRIKPQFVRYLELKSISTVGFEIDEIEVYGTGFVPSAKYVSNVLDMGNPMVWGQIQWAERIAGAAANSDVDVRVRSGSDDTPDVYYRVVSLGGGGTRLDPKTEDGRTLTQEIYENELRANERGPIQTDTEHWNQWLPVTSGTSLSLPAPRRYFQFKIEFANHALDAARAIDWLRFEYDRPPVDRVVAELSPSKVDIGVPTHFVFIARVENSSGLPGFKRFSIDTPARVTAIRSIELLDSAGQRLDGAEFTEDLRNLPQHQGRFAIEEVTDDHFTLDMPRVRASGSLVRVEFDAAVYRYGTRFAGHAFPDEKGGLPLQTEGGDASPQVETNSLLVRVSVDSQIGGPLEVEPEVMTPNGDGVNDVATLSYTVYHLLKPAPVELAIYDLSGVLVRRLPSTAAVNGRYTVVWDGLCGDGSRVPPGMYLAEVVVHSDRTTERRMSLIRVAY